MFKFCKIDLFGKTSKWVLEIKDLDTYKLWNEKYHTPFFKEGAENIKKRKKTWDEDEAYWKEKDPNGKKTSIKIEASNINESACFVWLNYQNGAESGEIMISSLKRDRELKEKYYKFILENVPEIKGRIEVY